MAKEKAKPWIVYTGPVELGYMHIVRPDEKFGEPVYKCEFFKTPEDAKAFVKAIESDPRAQSQKLRTTKVDGKIRIRSKQKAILTWVDKATGKPATRDMKPRLLHLVDGKVETYEGPTPYSGSVADLELEVVPYDNLGGGITLRIRGLLLHEIVTGTGGGTQWGGDTSYEGSDEGSAEEEPGDDDDDRKW